MLGKLFNSFGALLPIGLGLLMAIVPDPPNGIVLSLGILLILFGGVLIFAVWYEPEGQRSPTVVQQRSPAVVQQRSPAVVQQRSPTVVQQAGAVAASIDTMSGTEFERHVANIMRSADYTVTLTPTTGDFGVDLIAVRNEIRTAVQCKRQAKPVGAAAVQQVVAGAVMHRCTETMVVSNQLFTSAAQRLAMQHGCLLVGVTGLTKMLRAGR